MALESSIGQLPADPAQVVTFTQSGLHATFRGGDIRFALPLNASTIANAVHLRIRIDADGNSEDDYTAIYHYFPVDAAASTWEDYTEAQGVFEEQGTLTDLSNGSVRVELWNAFGNGDVQVDLGEAWLELPYDFSGSVSLQPVPALDPVVSLILVGCVLGVALRFGLSR